MTPKEKAKELVEKFEDFADYHDCDVFTQIERLKINAKQCAFILVNEIIIELQNFAFNNDIEDYGIENYWEEVNEQISTL
jgi:hypothetical protein